MGVFKEMQGLAFMWDGISLRYTVFAYVVWDWGVDPFVNHWVPLYTVPAHITLVYLRAHPEVITFVSSMLEIPSAFSISSQYDHLKPEQRPRLMLMPPPGEQGHIPTLYNDPRYHEGAQNFPSFMEQRVLDQLLKLDVSITATVACLRLRC